MKVMLVLALLSLGADYAHQDDVDGIAIDSRPVEGSRFVELRLTTTSTKSVEALCDAAFGDGSIDPNESEVKARKILESKPDERVTYDEVAAPMISDRDYAVRIQRYREPGGICGTRYAAANELAPKLRSGWVRIEKLTGGWRFEPKDGKTRVTYVNFTDPGGSLPAWVVEGSRRKAALHWVQRVLLRAKDAAR